MQHEGTSSDSMKRPSNTVERPFPMLLAGYYLARCSERVPGGRSKPPRALRAGTWMAAYNQFFDALGGGRTPPQFRNSLKNARDTYDTLFENGRIGWIDKHGRQPTLSTRFLRIHELWETRPDGDLEACVLGLRLGIHTPEVHEMSGDARSEGGERLVVSVQRERDPKLRGDALAIHGLDCMACGFNFGEFYGEIGREFIEVHHVVPLSRAGERETDPKTDLIVLCANCHRVVHRRSSVCLTLDELKSHIATAAAG